MFRPFTTDVFSRLLWDGEAAPAKLERWRKKWEQKDWAKALNRSHVSNMDLIHYLGLQCDEVLISCSMGIVGSFYCCQNAVPVITKWGLCWSINPPFDRVAAAGTVKLRV